jgi:hypothetical protein
VTAEQLVKGRGSPGTKTAQADGFCGVSARSTKTPIREADALGISTATLERGYRFLGGKPSEQERTQGQASWAR